jgi:cytochrome oxidase Cu insertion factor (SCO1/SenC/PrrC family)
MGLGILGLPTLAFGIRPKTLVAPNAKAPAKSTDGLPPATQGRGGDYFPNIVVYSHRGGTFHLYDDLIHDKVVMVNFMSIKGHEAYPVTGHLVRIADRLGNQLGCDVFMYSITTDPEHDTPKRLQALARHYGADRPGWYFLTTSRNSVLAVSKRLFKHGAHVGHAGEHPIRMVHYGNGGVGIWGAFGADTEPGFAVERVSWVKNGTQPGGTMRRAGPRRLDDNTSAGHNRLV